jgi:hypothetical protein
MKKTTQTLGSIEHVTYESSYIHSTAYNPKTGGLFVFLNQRRSNSGENTDTLYQYKNVELLDYEKVRDSDSTDDTFYDTIDQVYYKQEELHLSV